VRRNSPALLMLAAASLTACAPQALSPEERAVKDLQFCRIVPDAITPQDKRCGRYYSRIKAEQKQAEAARVAAEKDERDTRRAAAIAAADPKREISIGELAACRVDLRARMKDPDSFKINEKTTKEGGLIDFTATNGFGGPVRGVYRCTTGEMLER
jgi:hypothetical protein